MSISQLLNPQNDGMNLAAGALGADPMNELASLLGGSQGAPCQAQAAQDGVALQAPPQGMQQGEHHHHHHHQAGQSVSSQAV